MRRQAAKALAAGHKSSQRKLEHPLNIAGVGKGNQEVRWECTVPITISAKDQDTILSDYTAPTVTGSMIPGLWGLKSIREHRGILDTFSEPPVMYLVGPGDYEIKLPPGSRTLELANAPSGHLLLPVSDFDQLRTPQQRSREMAMQSSGDPLHLPVELPDSGPLENPRSSL